MTKILGLDLGTNSIGWAVVDKENMKILDSGVRIFPEGIVKDTIGRGESEVSRNAMRREHRQARRQSFRKKLRKIKLLQFLIDKEMCPLTHSELSQWKNWNPKLKSEGRNFPESEEFIEWLKMNPYELRVRALNEHITKLEFGRILYHFIQRRGFLTGRKQRDDGNIFKGSDNMKGISETKNAIEGKTLGQYLFNILPKDNRSFTYNNGIDGPERIRARYTLRDMYVDEFYKIWIKQASNLGIKDESIRTSKSIYVKGSVNNKKSKRKIAYLINRYGVENVVISENRIVCSFEKPLFNYLAGDVTYKDGNIVFKSNDSLLFFQRPLKSQKNLLNTCKFENEVISDTGKYIRKGKSLCPISHPDFERFRSFQFINNIKIGRGEHLNDDQRQKVFQYMCTKENNFDFKLIVDHLKLAHEKFNYSDDAKVPGNATIKKLSKLFDKDVWNGNYEEIWHCFYFFNDDSKLIEKLIRSYGLKDADIEKVSRIRLKDGYGNVSLKAIKNILPFLQKGYIYSTAVVLGGVRNAFGQRWTYFEKYHDNIEKHIVALIRKDNRKGDLIDGIKAFLSNPENNFGFEENDRAFNKLYHHSQEISLKEKQDYLSPIENLRNPIVQQTLYELRRLVNGILKKYRNEHGADFAFDRINIEMGRNIKVGKSERQKMTINILRNEQKNDEARERLREYGLKASRENVQKFLMFKEIEERNGNVVCPYTGNPISISDLFGKENKFQIEHIIPYSISMDDSFANKTLCESNFNRNKGELTPYQYYKVNPSKIIWGGLNSWDEISERAFRLLPYNKARKFSSQKDFILDDFLSRQLNDTRYISKKAVEILSEICDDVRSYPGQLTSELRHLWGLNNIVQPVMPLNVGSVHIDENDKVPHWVVLGKDKTPVSIVSKFNIKPESSDNQLLLPGFIKEDKFHNSEIAEPVLLDDSLPKGKYWMRTEIGEPEFLTPVFNKKPNFSEDVLVLRGNIQNNYFNHDSLAVKIPINGLVDGRYWGGFSILKKEILFAEKGIKPKVNKDQILLFGTIQDGNFKGYIYSCKTDQPDGKAWILLTLNLKEPDFYPVSNSKPEVFKGKIRLLGIVKPDGYFESFADPAHRIRVNQEPGRYWAVVPYNESNYEFFPMDNPAPECKNDESLLEGDVWVDKYTGEIRFDPKKNRDDQRHHAIDAVVIALTETSYLQKMSTYNSRKKEYFRGNEDRPTFDLPWDTFESDVKSSIDKILVSYRQNRKILSKVTKTMEVHGKTIKSKGESARGRLHREFYFGKYLPLDSEEKNSVFHIRKDISQIKNNKHVSKIVDAGIRKLIEDRLTNDFGINVNKSYSIPDHFFFDKDKNPALFLPNKNGDSVPVRKVRIREQIGNAVQLKGDKNVWVNPYNNHHVIIYKDHVGNWKEDIVSFWTVIERLKQGQPVFNLPEDGSEIIATLQENDMFLIGLGNIDDKNFDLKAYSNKELSNCLYRVQKLSSMYYTFRHHLASTILNDDEEIRIQSFKKWELLNPIKVKVNTYGEIIIP